MRKIFNLDKNKDLTIEMTEKYIEIFKSKYLPTFQKMERYYLNKCDIVNRTFVDTSKPNNKVSHSYASLIADNFASYLTGKPITFNSTNADLLREYNLISNYNDEQDVNMTIARNQSIFGIAYDLTYLDEDSNIRFTAIDTKCGIPIYTDTVAEELLYFIRFWTVSNILTNEETTYIEVYSNNDIKSYKTSKIGTIFTGSVNNPFKMVPVSVYKNNDYLKSDFADIIPLIDAYNSICSDELNELDYFCNCYVVWKNAMLDDEDVIKMKESGNIFLTNFDEDNPADVDFLTKNNNSMQNENIKNRIVEEIHKLSKMPNLTADAIKSHTSATAVRYSLLSLEMQVSSKIAKFKRGLQQRIERIVSILNIKGADYDYRDLKFVFNPNIPQAIESLSDSVSKLRGLCSDETLLELLPFVDNVELELQRIQKQNENQFNSYSDMFGSDDAEGDVIE